MEHKTPKHIVAVAGYLTNEKDEVLLAKVHWRSDTWELPGGQVEEGEALDQAICREIKGNRINGEAYRYYRSLL